MSNLINTKHILSIMVDNEPGVLARVVGLFSGRGYNIESLSVSEVDSDKFLSRVTIVTSGTKIIVDQIKAQLIGKKINIPVCLWDERLSTSAAYNLSSNLDIKFSLKKKKIDEKAATFILQGAIDYLNN